MSFLQDASTITVCRSTSPIVVIHEPTNTEHLCLEIRCRAILDRPYLVQVLPTAYSTAVCSPKRVPAFGRATPTICSFMRNRHVAVTGIRNGIVVNRELIDARTSMLFGNRQRPLIASRAWKAVSLIVAGRLDPDTHSRKTSADCGKGVFHQLRAKEKVIVGQEPCRANNYPFVANPSICWWNAKLCWTNFGAFNERKCICSTQSRCLSTLPHRTLDTWMVTPPRRYTWWHIQKVTVRKNPIRW